MRSNKQLILIWVFFILTILFIWSLNSWVNTTPAQTFGWHSDSALGQSELMCSVAESKDDHNGVTEPKLILFYKFPDYYELGPASGFEIFNSCSRKCELTVNSSRFMEADVVVFFSHSHIVHDLDPVPPVKQLNQIWVFFSVESPPFSSNSYFGNSEWHGLFNWTMSYRFDSEFWHGYLRSVQRVKPVEKEKRIENEKEWRNVFSKKTKLVAWFVSHCDTDSKREKYASELSKYITVDIYGKCGTFKCDDAKECLQMVRRDYKFYLSFENALCKDYVTEKLKNIFDIGAVVPVVRGGADYQKLFPANSVIDTSQFSSPESLAKYLQALADDEESYIKMFKWSWDYEIQSSNLSLCQLCERLYEHQHLSCVYNNIYAWWSHNSCHSPRDV